MSTTPASGSTPRPRAVRRVRPASARYTLPAEQAVALTDESSPAYLPGLVPDRRWARSPTPTGSSTPPATAPGSAGTSTTATCTTAASGSSGPGTTPTSSTSGCRRWTGSWTSSSEGATVADVGCGHGASTVLMARRSRPRASSARTTTRRRSRSRGRARPRGRRGRSRRLRGAAGRRRSPGAGFDLVTTFDALHDMGDPVGAARHVRDVAGRRRHLDGRRADGR